MGKDPVKPVMDTSDDERTHDGSESSVSQVSLSTDESSTPTLDFRNATEWANFVAGICLLALAGPPVGIVVFAAMVWEAIDRGFDGGFVDSGRELTGVLFSKLIPWYRETTQKFNERFVKRSDDAYMMNCIFAYGVLVPMMFFGCAYIAYHSETRMTSLWVLLLYHLVRIGPYFMNFAYVSRNSFRAVGMIGDFGSCRHSSVTRHLPCLSFARLFHRSTPFATKRDILMQVSIPRDIMIQSYCATSLTTGLECFMVFYLQRSHVSIPHVRACLLGKLSAIRDIVTYTSMTHTLSPLLLRRSFHQSPSLQQWSFGCHQYCRQTKR